MMTDKSAPELHKSEVLGEWQQATDAAIVALRRWGSVLKTFGTGTGDGADLQAEVARLDRAGLGEWLEWGAQVDGGLDALAQLLASRGGLNTDGQFVDERDPQPLTPGDALQPTGEVEKAAGPRPEIVQTGEPIPLAQDGGSERVCIAYESGDSGGEEMVTETVNADGVDEIEELSQLGTAELWRRLHALEARIMVDGKAGGHGLPPGIFRERQNLEFALASSELKNGIREGQIKDRNFTDGELITVESWAYKPGILARNSDCVDPLSLFLSLQHDQDERIQMALREMLESMSW